MDYAADDTGRRRLSGVVPLKFCLSVPAAEIDIGDYLTRLIPRRATRRVIHQDTAAEHDRYYFQLEDGSWVGPSGDTWSALWDLASGVAPSGQLWVVNFTSWQLENYPRVCDTSCPRNCDLHMRED